MLRSLYSGISGLRSHQTMLDVTGNNIANVNTAGFKSSSVLFQDTLSQVVSDGSAATDETGSTNPAQVGLGVQVAAISTNFAGGAGQATGKPTDLMISGNGFFAVQSGAETLYTRAGAFDFDSEGRLTTSDGDLVLGWTATDGVVNEGGELGPITLPTRAIAPAAATTSATFTGNLPDSAAAGTAIVRDLTVYDATGNASTVPVTFTRSATGWDVSSGGAALGALTFTDGELTSGGQLQLGNIDLDLSAVKGFGSLTTLAISEQDGREAGTLESYSIAPDGTVSGTFSNGAIQPIAQVALASFGNTAGLEKVGGSTFRASTSSGAATYGAPGGDGVGALASGYLEMSNVDLSQEFTNLIVAQRGFQANARMITSSDQVLEELTNLKR
jgi:flagellar hook protein FlgE